MERTGSFVTSMNIYQTSRRDVRENGYLHRLSCQNVAVLSLHVNVEAEIVGSIYLVGCLHFTSHGKVRRKYLRVSAFYILFLLECLEVSNFYWTDLALNIPEE
jgi:hypothetical protein